MVSQQRPSDALGNVLFTNGSGLFQQDNRQNVQKWFEEPDKEFEVLFAQLTRLEG